MYRIWKETEVLGICEKPCYVKRHPNGCYITSMAEDAEGIVFRGRPYALSAGGMGDCEAVAIEEIDAGDILDARKASTDEVETAVRLILKEKTDVSDTDAVRMQNLFPDWKEALQSGEMLALDTVVRHNEQLYRVVQSVTPMEHQPPGGEGMLAIYRPIDMGQAGTQEDPIRWVYGIDCTAGLYYEYQWTRYLCNGDMKPCVWAPDSGIWQWTEVIEE